MIYCNNALIFLKNALFHLHYFFLTFFKKYLIFKNIYVKLLKIGFGKLVNIYLLNKYSDIKVGLGK